MIRLSIALAALLVLSACSGAQLDKALKTIEGTYEPTAEELAEYKRWAAEHKDAPSVPDYLAGSSQISAIISAESVEPVVVAALAQPSSEVSSEYVAEVLPEVCATSVWRGRIYDCHGAYVGDVE